MGSRMAGEIKNREKEKRFDYEVAEFNQLTKSRELLLAGEKKDNLSRDLQAAPTNDDHELQQIDKELNNSFNNNSNREVPIDLETSN
ncbi:hypothetical protein AAES_98354 [Amazona aestiva]|uniref:Uncharacterized protein n=1 Tax=Amazona aestiva TaxID=12930 RepID=A0A0Q3PV17_AMAAE|nr:hypothetical protein AAES_98354 [Amazona aestiva]